LRVVEGEHLKVVFANPPLTDLGVGELVRVHREPCSETEVITQGRDGSLGLVRRKVDDQIEGDREPRVAVEYDRDSPDDDEADPTPVQSREYTLERPNGTSR
jgi:hypothetical protein